MLADFGAVVAVQDKCLGVQLRAQFMEDGNSAHGYKSKTNCCVVWRASKGITLFLHPSISPDMNPIEKCWRRIKQSLYRQNRQPTNEAEMQAVVLEEWDKIP
jgi:DDE superfamily endonuclease